MKKSPLSTPGGSRRKPGYACYTPDGLTPTGYDYVKGDKYQCYTVNGDTNCRGDFIPLNISTPVSDQKRYNSWNNSGRNRNLGSGVYNNHYRNNYNSPKSHFNNSYSPYKNSGNKSFYGQKKVYQKGVHRQVDISQYVNVKSFLEDPWAELTWKLNDSKNINNKDVSKTESLGCSDSNISNKFKQARESKASVVTDCKGSELSQELKNESFTNVSSEIDDSDLNGISKADSSIDLSLGDIKFSQESQNQSPCSLTGSADHCASEESNLHLNDANAMNAHDRT